MDKFVTREEFERLEEEYRRLSRLAARLPVKFMLKNGGICPTKATDGSAGYDLYAPCDFIVKPGRQVIPLGVYIALPFGYEATVQPRSGFSLKGFEGYKIAIDPVSGAIMCNSANEIIRADKPSRFDCDVELGEIDSDYRESIGVIIKNRDQEFLICAGTRIAQMIIRKVEEVDWIEVDSLDETTRQGGFGSTGTGQVL